MKKLILITTLISLYSVNSFANPYMGFGFQKNGFSFKKNSDGINPAGYNDISSNVSGFVGYEFNQFAFMPYHLSIESSYFTDKNSLHSADYNSEIRFETTSLNTINHYHFNKTISFIGIVGVNYTNFKFNESSTGSEGYSYSVTDRESGLGVNYGLGLSIVLPKIHNLDFKNKVSVRAKIVRSVFNGIRPEIDSINQIDGMTSISLDFKYNF